MLLTQKEKKKRCMKMFWCFDQKPPLQLCFYGIGPFSQVLSHITNITLPVNKIKLKRGGVVVSEIKGYALSTFF